MVCMLGKRGVNPRCRAARNKKGTGGRARELLADLACGGWGGGGIGTGVLVSVAKMMNYCV